MPLHEVPMHIKTNGQYKVMPPVRGSAGDMSIFYISGAAGAATLQLVYFNSDGVPVDFEDGLFVPGVQYKVEHGADMAMALIVTNADGVTDYVIDIRSIGA